MKILKTTLFLFLLALAGSAAFAQQDTIGIRTVIARQNKFAESYPVEKVYVHTDKPYYASGDTIWFKAYVTVDLHQPTILSKVVYIDLISSTDTIMRAMKLPVINGFAQGNVTLDPLTYKQGNYRIRAYTTWMRNFDPGNFFVKNIPVADADKQLSVRAVFAPAAKGAATSARIIYKNADGEPYSNKKVSWHIETLEKTLEKGRGVTDQNGVLQVGIPAARIAADDAETLVASVETDGKKPLVNSFAVKANTRNTDVQFFPEGGKLLAGADMRVAFKAVKPDGLGIDIKGTVTDNDGKTCATFASQHLGMGSFLLTPESGKTYKASVTFPNGTPQVYSLPAVQQSGITLAVNSLLPSAVGIRIIANQAYLDQNKGKPYYIIGKIGEAVVYGAQTPLQDKTYDIAIPKAKLISGVLQITLMDTHGQPLAERLAFVQNKDALNVVVRADKPSYTKRQKVKLTLTAQKQLQPAEGNFSVAVVDETKAPFNDNDEASILSYLLLSSDLKGYIEKPGYYFNHQDNTTMSDLDALMMTQGYRRFAYTDLLANRLPQIRFLAEQGIDITGTLRNGTGMPLSRGNVRLSMADRHFTQAAVSDVNGMFKFSNIPLIDSVQVTISARGTYGANNLMLMVDAPTLPAVTGNAAAPDAIADIDSTYRTYIKNSKQQYSNSRLLKEVVIKGAPVLKLPSHADYPSLAGLSQLADHTISGKNFEGCTDFLSCLRTMAMGLTYDQGNFYVTRNYNSGDRTPVQIFLNGLAVDNNALVSMNPADVLSAEIFVKDDLGLVNRMYNSNGVLAINTKAAALKSMPKTKISIDQLKDMMGRNDEVTIRPQGYSLARQFYVPRYEPGKLNGIGVDLRSTVYWNPQVKTDKATGAASVEFFNSDGRGSYRAIVEGIDAEGHLGRTVYKYKVE
ncbi:carboxypeptidase regulatory-like domain-containing protein [Mucilaginibacter sp.]